MSTTQGLEESQAVEATPPTLALLGLTEVEVEMNSLFTRCTESSPESAVCDRGVTALDTLDGDITHRVLACSWDGVTPKFHKRGLQG